MSATLSDRIDAWFAKDPHATFYERIDLLLESEPIYADLPPAMRYGRTLRYILERMNVVV